jgi:hypothetical protein
VEERRPPGETRRRRRAEAPGEAAAGAHSALGERDERETRTSKGGFFGWADRGERPNSRAGFPRSFAGMDSAWLSCEARFELHNRAWLRGYICIRWA